MIRLALEFFKIGLFSVGGGLATLPFLYELAEKTSWFDVSDISNMVAISESTPGPIGVNMASFTGFKNSGVLGSIIASFSLVLPSLIIIMIIAKFLDKFKNSRRVKDVFYGLRAASTALIAAAGLNIFKLAFFSAETNVFSYKSAVLGVILGFILVKFKKIHPIVLIILSAVAGVLFKF